MQPLTLIDFPGHLATVLFLQGCNLRCKFCYNRTLLPGIARETIAWSGIVDFLKDRQGFVEGVVFSGGEPCMQPGILKAIRQVREMGFAVALHTNGFYPEIVEKALQDRLLQFIAVDFKAPLERYGELTGQNADAEAFTRLADLIAANGVKHEYRTTVHPHLLKDADILAMADWLAEKKIKNYAVQKFRHGEALDQNLPPLNGFWLADTTIFKLRSRFSGFEVRGDSSNDKGLQNAA